MIIASSYLDCGKSFPCVHPRGFLVPVWSNVLFGTGLAISIALNALVTGLVVFRVFKVFREVRAASNERILGATGGDTLGAIID